MSKPMNTPQTSEEQVAANFQVEKLDQRLETAWSMASQDGPQVEHEAPTKA
ncbi:hypothetical protein [Hymenobacter mucosus]|uniref:Uncharacterized protein n=1 Tax=Hymenobacter mucosus TaxID=1411120 RepID=A0A238ZWV5_9BACT|nr:hypothetical protein [Hymenobacter mucosus]SNR87739.1 hypothetical protein SAMN06269173_11037 [Hymenobacter mucosus]